MGLTSEVVSSGQSRVPSSFVPGLAAQWGLWRMLNWPGVHLKKYRERCKKSDVHHSFPAGSSKALAIGSMELGDCS